MQRGDGELLVLRGINMKKIKIVAVALVLASTAAHAVQPADTAPNENASCAGFFASFMPGNMTRYAHRGWADNAAHMHGCS